MQAAYLQVLDLFPEIHPAHALARAACQGDSEAAWLLQDALEEAGVSMKMFEVGCRYLVKTESIYVAGCVQEECFGFVRFDEAYFISKHAGSYAVLAVAEGISHEAQDDSDMFFWQSCNCIAIPFHAIEIVTQWRNTKLPAGEVVFRNQGQ